MTVAATLDREVEAARAAAFPRARPSADEFIARRFGSAVCHARHTLRTRKHRCGRHRPELPAHVVPFFLRVESRCRAVRKMSSEMAHEAVEQLHAGLALRRVQAWPVSAR